MQLSALAIALQGIGYGTHLVAAQGLLAADVGPVPDLPPPVQAQGVHAAAPVRRRVRRFSGTTGILPLRPLLLLGDEADDEEALALAGIL